ncbi:unnamed protein product, partial [Effrenium voratum]
CHQHRGEHCSDHCPALRKAPRLWESRGVEVLQLENQSHEPHGAEGLSDQLSHRPPAQ